MKKGFTLIELLVVIAIIALLVSILLPSLTKAKELAQKVVCANNMHALGIAEMFYADENDGYIMLINGTRLWYDFLIFSDPFDYNNSRKYVYIDDTHILTCPSREPKTFNFDNASEFTDANWWQNYAIRFNTYGIHLGYASHECEDIFIGGNYAGARLNLYKLASPAELSVIADTSGTNGSQFYIYSDFSYMDHVNYWGVALGHVKQANVLFADGHLSGLNADGLEDNDITAYLDENFQPVQ